MLSSLSSEQLLRNDSIAHWARVPLNAVCQPTELWRPERNPRDRIVYIDVSAVSRDSFSITASQNISGHTAPSRARKIVHADDVIFATVRPTLRRVAVVDQSLHGQVASTAFCVVRADRRKAVPRFLYYTLLSDHFINEIAKYQSGASYPAVNDKDVFETSIALPPIDEQQRIVAVLSTAQRALDVQRQIINALRELKQGAMQQLFARGLRGERQKETEIGLVPESWSVRPFESLREFLQYGTSSKCDYQPIGNPVLRIPNVVEGAIETSDIKWCSLEPREIHGWLLEDGDILFVRTNGVRERVGTCAVYHGEPKNALFASYLIRARVRRDVTDPDFVQYFTATQRGRTQLAGQASPAADGKFNVNTKSIDALTVPVPTLGEQAAIVGNLQTIDRKLSHHVRKRATLQDLFGTLLNQLMTGRLRTDDIDFDLIGTEPALAAPARV